ncbi:MAG: hypothetical protein LBT81_02075 [Helicobacteraceae bacterium]|nr:hypothetical protein [Helicobacteraceae bacterium]
MTQSSKNKTAVRLTPLALGNGEIVSYDRQTPPQYFQTKNISVPRCSKFLHFITSLVITLSSSRSEHSSPRNRKLIKRSDSEKALGLALRDRAFHLCFYASLHDTLLPLLELQAASRLSLLERNEGDGFPSLSLRVGG